MFLLLFYSSLVFACLGFCAGEHALESSFSGVKILYVCETLQDRISASFSLEDDVCVDDGYGAERGICDVLQEQMLAGFYFAPNVDQRYWGNPALWQRGLRNVSCVQTEFFSSTIRRCFDKIPQGDQEISEVKERRSMVQKDVLTVIYPEGKTRKWLVTPLQGLAKRDFSDVVFMMFGDSADVLWGELCDISCEKNLENIGSILHIKHTRCVEKQQKCLPHQVLTSTEIPDLEQFLRHGLAEPMLGVGLIYFPTDGGRVDTLLDFSEETQKIVSFLYDPQEKDTSLQERKQNGYTYLHDELFSGFVPNQPLNPIFGCFHEKYISQPRLLRAPGVREALCHRASFFSKALRDILKDGRIQDEAKVIELSGWKRMPLKHFKAMYSDQKTLQWSLVDKDTLPTMFSDGSQDRSGRLFMVFGKDSVALKGTPVFLSPACREELLQYSILHLELRRQLYITEVLK